MSCSTRVRGIEVGLTSLLLGTPVAIHSLSINEVTNSSSETTWSRVLRLTYIALTVHHIQYTRNNSTLLHGYGSTGLHV